MEVFCTFICKTEQQLIHTYILLGHTEHCCGRKSPGDENIKGPTSVVVFSQKAHTNRKQSLTDDH